MKFRKKPVVIEAHQWNPEERPSLIPEVFARLIFSNPDLFDEKTGVLTIRTLEGDMACQPGDWIIRGVQGEFYPCKPDIFAQTYEPAEDRP